MVNPGAFRGVRFEFLTGEKATYAAAVKEGHAAEAIALIQRRYFKRFPIDLPHTDDPTPEFLASVNDSTPDPELPEIDNSALSEEEYLAELQHRSARAKMIEYRKAQIKRWLAYQYMKDRDVDPKDTGEDNPLQILRYRLTGVGLKKPRKPNPVNLWRKSVTDIIEAAARDELKATVAAEGRLPMAKDHNKLAGIREKTARRMFNELTEADRKAWAEQADEDYQAALSKYQQDKVKPFSTDPRDRQQCIEALVPFIQPILDLIVEATGMKASAIVGGPEPADQGRINIISIHSGTMPGHVPMNFGRAERAAYKKVIVPIFGRFLRRCWTPAECRAQALDTDFEGLNAMDLDKNDINLDVVPHEDNVQGGGDGGDELVINLVTVPCEDGVHAGRDEQNQRAGEHQILVNPLLAISPPIAHSTSSATSTSEAVTTTTPGSVPSMVAPAIISPALTTAPAPPLPVAPMPPTATSATKFGAAPILSTAQQTAAPSTNVSTTVRIPQEVRSSTPNSPFAHHATLPPADALPSTTTTMSHQAPQDYAPVLTEDQLQEIRDAFSTHQPPSRSPSTDPWGITASGPSPVITPIPTPVASPTRPGSPPVSHSRVATPSPTASPTRKRLRTGTDHQHKDDAPHPKRARRNTEQKRQGAKKQGSASNLSAKATAGAKNMSAPRSHRGIRDPLRPVDNAAVSTSSIQSPPAATPKWYLSAVATLTGEDLRSPLWTALLTAWQAFEIESGFLDMPPLRATHRPNAVKQWIGRRRSPTWRPVVADAMVYGKEHMKWWTALQPEWRISNGVVVKGIRGDLSSVKVSGPNGILSVVASLFYWGLNAKGARERAHWEQGVTDCHDVIVSK